MNHLSIVSACIRSAFFARAALIAASATLAGCFYFAPINDGPIAQIEKQTLGIPARGQAVLFTAAGSFDSNGDELTVDWSAQACGIASGQCDATPIGGAVGRPILDSFVVEVPHRRSPTGEPTEGIKITATVTDTHGAFHTTELFVDIANLPPSLELQVQGLMSASGTEVPIGTSVRVVAAGFDPDCDVGGSGCAPLDYMWRYFAPPGSQEDAVSWEPVDEMTYELRPDIEGTWEVEVTATDELGASVSERRAIVVREDQPPCIDVTDPAILDDAGSVPGQRYILDRDQGPRRLAVLSVTDDLDVYPAPSADETPLGSTRFRWLLATPDTGGAFVEVANHTVADYLVDPSAFVPGDVLSVRVEIDDRVGRDIVCGEADPICSISGDGCRQRVTWDLEAR